MNLFDGHTLADYDHAFSSGQEISVSAEQDRSRPPYVCVCATTMVNDLDGNLIHDLTLTPSESRDLAESLILAADHAEGVLS